MTEFTDEDLRSIREFARRIVALPEFTKDDMKDVEQDLALGLFKMSDQFRSKKSSWNTFRWHALEQISGKIKRSRMQQSARYMTAPTRSLNEPTTQDPMAPDEFPTLMDSVTNDHQLADGTEDDGTEALGLIIDVRQFVCSLPDDLKRICHILETQVTIREAADILKIPRQSLERKIQKIRE